MQAKKEPLRLRTVRNIRIVDTRPFRQARTFRKKTSRGCITQQRRSELPFLRLFFRHRSPAPFGRCIATTSRLLAINRNGKRKRSTVLSYSRPGSAAKMPTGSMINRALRYYLCLTFARGDVAEYIVAIKVARVLDNSVRGISGISRR